MEASDVSSSSSISFPTVPKKRKLEDFTSGCEEQPDTTGGSTSHSAGGSPESEKKENGSVEASSESNLLEKKPLTDFEGFTVKRILINSADAKRVIVEAGFGGDTAIVVLDKQPFTEETVKEVFTKESSLERILQNDIYGSYTCSPTRKGSEIKTTIVYPATEKHIEKYLFKPLHLVIESPELYERVTLPYLESSAFSIDWVYNILEHKQEAERIVFEDPDPVKGFILLPDLKWDGTTLENLYLLAIVHQRGIKSLRDLTSAHLPLLENIVEVGSKAVEEKYGLKKSCLRMYLHYQPSYYHLHVHFTALQYSAPGNFSEKSHILQSVIGNLKSNPSHYQQATLPFVVKAGDKLFNCYEKDGYEF